MEDLAYKPMEIQLSIINVFNSDFTTKEISSESGISYTAINELRNGKRQLANASFEINQKLYTFAINHNLTKAQQDDEMKKGHYTHAAFEIAVKNIYVSFNQLDLFANGCLLINNSALASSKKNELVRLDIANTVVELRNGYLIDANNLGCRFQCRYGGTGPNNLVRFLTKYSAIQEEELKAAIFTKSVIRYNFEEDCLYDYASVFDDSKPSINMYALNEKMIFAVSNLNMKSRKPNDDLERVLNAITVIHNIMTTKYGCSDVLSTIKYINNFVSSETKIYALSSAAGSHGVYHIILQFEDYEIWIAHSFYGADAYLWNDEQMQKIISLFDNVVPQYPKKKIHLNTTKSKPCIQELSFTLKN